MTKQATLNIGSDINLIHLIISRGLLVSIENSKKFHKDGFPGSGVREGFLNYIKSLVTVLDTHHRLEDEIAFPGFQNKFPDAPYELLESQHQEIVSLLEELQSLIAEMDKNNEEMLEALISCLTKINELWIIHIGIEEGCFSGDNIARLMNYEEQLKLSMKFAEFGRENSKPEYYVVPFMIFNTPKENREFFYNHMPPVVTQQLVPGEWKEKWQSMKQFLLEE
jgi:hemerythrin-like domain-containing protein